MPTMNYSCFYLTELRPIEKCVNLQHSVTEKVTSERIYIKLNLSKCRENTAFSYSKEKTNLIKNHIPTFERFYRDLIIYPERSLFS